MRRGRPALSILDKQKRHPQPPLLDGHFIPPRTQQRQRRHRAASYTRVIHRQVGQEPARLARGVIPKRRTLRTSAALHLQPKCAEIDEGRRQSSHRRHAAHAITSTLAAEPRRHSRRTLTADTISVFKTQWNRKGWDRIGWSGNGTDTLRRCRCVLSCCCGLNPPRDLNNRWVLAMPGVKARRAWLWSNASAFCCSSLSAGSQGPHTRGR